MYTKEEVLEIVIEALPLSKHIEKLNLQAKDNAIEFIWWQIHFVVYTDLRVDVIQGIMISSPPNAMLFEELLKHVAYKREIAKKLRLPS